MSDWDENLLSDESGDDEELETADTEPDGDEPGDETGIL